MNNLGIHTTAGTIGGTLLGIFLQLQTGEGSALLATALGAAVSFCVSLGLKELVKWLQKEMKIYKLCS